MLKKQIHKIVTVSFIVLLAVVKLYSQSVMAFQHLTVESGLSQGSVLSITQDVNGFIWIGTMDGLNRYDGKDVKIYKSFYKDNPIGASIKITQLVADKYQNLWIATNNGLYVYDSKIDSFYFFFHKENNPNSLSNDRLNALYKDENDCLWIGTENGLDRIKLDPHHNYNFEHVRLEESINPSLSHNVQAINKLQDGTVWVGTTKGLAVLNKKENKDYTSLLKQFSSTSVSSFGEDNKHNIWIGSSVNGICRFNEVTGEIDCFNNAKNILSNVIRRIHVDKKGKVWIGSLKGLMIYDDATHSFQSFVHKPEDDHTLNYNSIYDIYEDVQGNMWVGTFFGGVNIAEAITTPFTVYKNKDNKNSISSNVVSSIVSDSLNNLWIGTEAEGLNYFDRKKQLFYNFKNEEKNTASINSNLVKVILKDKENVIWIGLHNGVLDKVSKSEKQFKHYMIPGNGTGFNSDDIMSLIEDEHKNIWIGKVETGVYIMNKNEGNAKTFETVFPGKKLSNKAVTYLYEDSRKNIWIGTKKGLNVLNASQTELNTYYTKDGLQSDYINCITEDKSGIVWIGTYSGLSYYDYKGHSIKALATKDFLSGRKIVGIIPDNENNLWVSTNNGLVRIDSTRAMFTSYNKFDGLPGDVFNYNSFNKDNAGQLYFGGYNGFVAFNPKDIEMNKDAPSILLTGLSINGAAVRPRDSRGILSDDILATKEIQLAYNQNIVTINYAVLNYIKPLKNMSAYMLDGYDKSWTVSETQTASYTNLPSGTYKLLIRGANNDGVWSESRLYLTIVVHPPFWKTWWAYMIYCLVFLAALYGAFRFFISREKFKRDFQYEHMLNLKQNELHQMKMDFFTHISHEIRTPLTLIVGPTDMLLGQELPPHIGKKLLLSVKSNAERLLKLTNELLDFRKADAGYMRLRIQHADLICFAKNVFDKFSGKAFQKNINYTFLTEEEKIEAYFDQDQLEIVISNLLSNALKFTNEYGVVSVVIEKDRGYAIIKVIDNGIGIPEEKQEKIFTHFYQAVADDDSKTGSGIGLAFSKKLMELHCGDLQFTSKKNIETNSYETCFIISIPLGKWHLHTVNKFITAE